MAKVSVCPACSSSALHPFFRLENVPAHQNLLMSSREAAHQCERGDILLGVCEKCGFITNLAFESARLSYSAQYDNSQSYSSLFQTYMEQLAADLIERYDLYGKEIVEIGCGKGEFLTRLCELGHNHGTGFDPSYVANGAASDRVTFIQDFYSERYADYQADLICCRHVIEHIQYPAQLAATVRQSMRERLDSVIFFEMPNVLWILRQLAFWDIFYEHCSYFSPASLTYLFAKNRFEVLQVTETFGGQYLWLEARPRKNTQSTYASNGVSTFEIIEAVTYFVKHYQDKIDYVRKQLLNTEASKGKRAVIWGAGAKGVTILNTLNILPEAIEFVVDINPRKQGKYIPGTGQQIVSPDFLRTHAPDTIFVMNPNYLPEIRDTVAAMELHSQIFAL